MKNGYLLFLVIVLLCFLNACEVEPSKENKERMEEKPYTGEQLTIGVVGSKPDIREKRVRLYEISLEELLNTREAKYNAVIIMPDHLAEASNKKYVEMYKRQRIPFFFVKSQAGIMPYLDMESPVDYEEQTERVNNDWDYISGILYEGKEEGYRSWALSYPIENSKYNRGRTKEIFSSLFKTIEKEKNLETNLYEN